MADSRSGESQMLAKEEITAVVAEAHRRNLRVGIHSRGAGSTRAAAEAGVNWIIHADLATECSGDADVASDRRDGVDEDAPEHGEAAPASKVTFQLRMLAMKRSASC